MSVGVNVGGFVGVFVASHCDLNDGCDGHDFMNFDEGAYYE